MSYLVFCTFDLKNASTQDYQDAYEDLASLGLQKIVTRSQGAKVVIPTTAAMGTFTGSDAATVCTDIRDQVQGAFEARGLKSELFLVTGGDWAWVPGST
ncbi:hypothetical protein [Polaromonas sp.]|uniref:hypothetical protein n=1 Tax=Polaromonas sp. TaxID=1869339 RepID=UPI00248965D0|nr:hypothetical protein [Polaromonas sp.]MDI1340869.1 hypothetical protein [Polaromonas sp.]